MAVYQLKHADIEQFNKTLVGQPDELHFMCNIFSHLTRDFVEASGLEPPAS